MTLPRILLVLATGCLADASLVTPVHAQEKAQGHVQKKAGPNGGRVITKVTPHVEVLILPDRKVKLTFLDEAGKPLPVSQQTATVTSGDRMNPVKLTFSTKDGALVSEQPLPTGQSVPVVLQLKATPDGPVVTEKFGANLSICPECKLSEYSCTCEH
ncbi:MAG TPA: hypothetical protein VIM57_04095 [Luteolibacter sp.]